MNSERPKETPVQLLENFGAVVKKEERSSATYRLSFKNEIGVTTIRIILDDETGADVVITNMTTLPETEIGKGYGSTALHSLLSWARESGLHTIRAVQVRKDNENFWIKNGFTRYEEPNPTSDYILNI